MARQQAAKQARGLAHPQLCLDAIAAGIASGGLAGLQKVQLVLVQIGGKVAESVGLFCWISFGAALRLILAAACC